MHTKLKMMPPAMVFSDLDGTLLDHHTYSFKAALPAIKILDDHNVPVIPTTSKTIAEVTGLMQEIGLHGPLIFENGAGVAIPTGFLPITPDDCQLVTDLFVKSFAPSRESWQPLFEKLKAAYKSEFEIFSEMSIARIAELTGLPIEKAKLAAQREYGEPVKWLSSEDRKQAFLIDLKKHGVEPLVGGRFIHVSSHCNKGKAMLWLIKEVERQFNHSGIQSIALGDGNNDIDMLESAEFAVRIPSPVNPRPTLQRIENVYDPSGFGPVGWTEAVQQILPKLNLGVN